MAQDREEFNVPVDAAWGVLLGILLFFTVVTVISLFVVEGSPLSAVLRPSDMFLSARSSAGAYAIAMSYFASGMGAWIVYGTTEMGATRALSWWGVIGYSTGSAVGGIVIGSWLGPKIKRAVGDKGYSATDFALQRYGRLMHIFTICISCFYMYIYMVAEYTSIGNVYALLVGKSTEGNDSKSYTTDIAITVAVLTWSYTALGGLPASIFTDKFQGIVIAGVVAMLLVATTTQKRNEISRKEFDQATGWFSKGFEALVTLWIAITSAELFNQGTWQRVWAAKSDAAMRNGFLIGAFLVMLIMLFFGVMGMIAYANDREAYDNFEKLAYLSFFDLLLPLPRTWHFVTLALLTTLAASSVDTLQNGLASVLSHDLVHNHLSPNWSRLIVVVLNIAAVIQASDRFEVVPLFLVADLVCATSVGPLFSGLMQTDRRVLGIWIPAPTELGAFMGCVGGIVTVIVNGIVNDVNKAVNPYTGEVYARGPIFSYFWLTNTKSNGTPYECSLCGTKTMVTFIIVPIISTFCCFFFSAIDLYVGGEKARQPFIVIPRLDGDQEEEEELVVKPVSASKAIDEVDGKLTTKPETKVGDDDNDIEK